MENAPRDEAVELLLHYFDRAGVVKSNDCRYEIRRCVELILEAAVERTLQSPAMQQLLSDHV